MNISSLAFTLALGTTLAAQSVVIPSAAATTRPTRSPYWTANVFYSSSSATPSSHTQSIVDVNDVTAPTAAWNSLSVRRPVGLGNANSAFTTNATIVLSVSANAWSAASTTFASNTGPNATTVISGMISLPAAANQATWPAPWQTPFPFSTPFVFAQAMGKSLVIDILQTGNTATTPWYLEATTPDVGTRSENGGAQSSCKFSNGVANQGLGYRLPIVGGTWTVTYQSGQTTALPAGLVGVGAIGGQGLGGVWGGLPLPIDLAAFGAPGCKWSVSADFTVPLTSSTSTYSWPTLNVPNDPNIGGQSWYDHAMFLDAGANAWGVVTTWSSKWTVGTLLGAPGAFLSATGSSAGNATGSLTKGLLPTLQLN